MMLELSYREAITRTLAREMARDPCVVLLGEDIGHGGVFNVTPGLLEEFGADRVIDTPISELAFSSAAFGLAISGFRPVVEIMFGDFLGLVWDTLVNQASKYWFISNGQASVPLVVRTAVGAGARFAACHSQTPIGLFLSEPGLKIVAPSTPDDAARLTLAAIRDDNPVLVFEHKVLYGRKGEVHDSTVPGEIGRAAIRRSGGDATIVAALAAVEIALEAADLLEADGVEVEVIDLCSLRPLDFETVLRSAARTGRVVVVEEGPPCGGYSSEVLGKLAESGSPVQATRISMPDLPVPFSPRLEDLALPSVSKVATAVRSLENRRVGLHSWGGEHMDDHDRSGIS